MNKDVYLTKDLYEAAALYSLNKKFVGLKEDSGFYWFQFEDKQGCEQIADGFWSKKINVNAKAYAEAIRTLKDRIFARN
jgi:hypothetical protein